MSPSTWINLLGYLNIILAGTMALPLLVNWIYGEPHTWAFLYAMGITAFSGLAMVLLFKQNPRDLTHRDGIAIVAFAWICASFFGGLPYLFTGTFHSLADSFFETASGFTTTGASVIAEVEKAAHGVLFWRGLTHWFGGLGIVLLSVAILPFLGIGGMQLYKAESPGITHDKLSPRMAQTARILWEVYLLITGIQIGVMLLGGMNWFDSLCHTFATMGTGGFSTKNISVEAFKSPFLEYAISFFMFVAGANFVLHYRFLKGDWKAHWKDDEFRFYTYVVLIATLLIAFNLFAKKGIDFLSSFRLALFQVVSIQTTTGFTSTDFEKWPFFSQALLVLLMFIGGCTGSTGGAIKCVRILILIRHCGRELFRLVHPRAVVLIKLNRKVIPPEILQAIWGMTFIYLGIYVVATLAVAALGLDLVTAATSVAATLGNVGPGLGEVGPSDNYGPLPSLVKWILSFCMLAGRLEIYTLTVLFHPAFWRK